VDDAVVILSADSSKEEARNIARTLVEEGLAACVQIVPGVESVYLWQGKLCEEPEFLLVLKSRLALFHRVEERIRSLHHYDVPEIVAVPICAGSEAYLGWMESLLAKPKI
jgi:periplasmic divalent cation tolerance protein